MIAAHYDHVASHPAPRSLHQARRYEHNQVKRFLLSQVAVMLQNNVRVVVDLACGKGGDLQKVVSAFPESLYIGIDISGKSLTELYRRASRDGLCDRIVCAQMCATKLSLPQPADVVMMNFALHYMASSQTLFESLLDAISRNLRPGGLFVGCCVDWRRLQRGDCEGVVQTGDALQNLLENPWGRKYRFVLPGCVDADEYAVCLPAIVPLAHKYGLELVRFRGFDGFLRSCQYEPCCSSSNSMYAVFVFRQTRVPHNAPACSH